MADHERDRPRHLRAGVRRALTPGRWAGVELKPYKVEPGTPYQDVTRQELFSDPKLKAELRYFEVGPGGHSTLERHEHLHAVVIHRGRGRCLVGNEVWDIAAGDLVFVPELTWHQFRAAADMPLGFLCMVDRDRDRPMQPTREELIALKMDIAVSAFLSD